MLVWPTGDVIGSSALPKLGETIEVRARFPSSQGLGFMATGLVPTGLVPLSLHGEAMVWLDPSFLVTVPVPVLLVGSGGGRISQQLSIPSDPTLSGLELPWQGFLMPYFLQELQGTNRLSVTLR